MKAHHRGPDGYDPLPDSVFQDPLHITRVWELSFTATTSSIPNGELEKFGSINSVEDGSALMARSAAGSWNGGKSGSANVFVDCDVSEHYFDDTLIPGLHSKFADYQALNAPRKIIIDERRQLNGFVGTASR